MIAALAASPLDAASNLTLSADGLTVYDSANGITWLADANLPATNRFGLPACNGSNSGTQTCINASGSMNYQAAVAWVNAMNAANYLGHSNWQLPTTPLTDKNCGKTGPNGNSFGFGCTAAGLASIYAALGLSAPASVSPISTNSNAPFSNFQPYLYWSESSAGPTAGNYTFSFATGWQGANTLPNFLYLLPMVPGRITGIPTPTENGLQADPGGQTVYDPVTDVTWLANANLAATNTFNMPRCTNPAAPTICVAADGAMTWPAALEFLANMNRAAYLNQTNWQAPDIDSGCPGFGCAGTRNAMGNLYYSQFGLSQGTPIAPLNAAPTGPFHNLQPYLYWSCSGSTIQSACAAAGPVSNQEWSYSFGAGFEGTDLVANNLYVIPYFAGTRSGTQPVITQVANAEGEAPQIAPNTWIEIKGANLAPAGDTRIWANSDFKGTQMPISLDGVSVTVNGKPAFVYYISPTQINVLTPPDALSGTAPVTVSNSAGTASFPIAAQSISPSFFVFNGGPYVAAEHAVGSFVGPTTLYPGNSAPALPGETIMIYANGFGPTSVAIVTGSEVQSGTLNPLPVVTIGGINATVVYAGLVLPGEFQFNVVVPAPLTGDQPIVATYNGVTTQAGALLSIHN